MSSGGAEFILEGDSTQVVTAYHLVRQEIKMLESDMNKMSARTKQLTADEIQVYEKKSKELTHMREIYKLLTDDIKKAGEAESKSKALTFDYSKGIKNLQDAARSGANYRQVMTNLSYATSDFLSVSGGFAEHLRAVANNLQMVAMAIPGPWGMVINVGTMAAQAFTAFNTSGKNSNDTLKQSADIATDAAKAYANLRDEVLKTAETEDAFDRQRKLKQLDEEVEKTRKLIDVENEKVGSANRSTIAGAGAAFNKSIEEGMLDPWDFGKGMKFVGAGANLAWQSVTRPFGNTEADLNEVRKAEVGRRGAQDTFLAASQRREQIMREYDQKKLNEKAERELGPAKDDLTKVYGRDVAEMGPDAARRRLVDLTRSALTPGSQGAAESVSKGIADKFDADLRGKQIANAFNPKTAGELQEEQVRKQLDAAKIAAEKARLEHGDERHMTDATRRMIKGFDDVTKALDVTLKTLHAQNEDAKTAKETKLLGSNPFQQLQPQQNRNAGL